ncbi:Uncharacterised protein [Yersinia ruckeri]|uniref:Uncharacterized protein n=1 Tax=Yersinia ruckeri TaxID=29486 RepID=A0A380S8V7_YERRU|nr:Uncharacterised protein [Yersinia ruckeri]
MKAIFLMASRGTLDTREINNPIALSAPDLAVHHKTAEPEAVPVRSVQSLIGGFHGFVADRFNEVIVFVRSNSDILILRDRAAFPANIRRRFRTVHFCVFTDHMPLPIMVLPFASSQMMLTLVCSLKSLIEVPPLSRIWQEINGALKVSL